MSQSLNDTPKTPAPDLARIKRLLVDARQRYQRAEAGHEAGSPADSKRYYTANALRVDEVLDAADEMLELLAPEPCVVGCQNTTGSPACSKCPFPSEEGGANG